MVQTVKKLQNASKRFKIFKIVQNGSKRFNMVQYGSIWFNMVQYVPKWSNMVQYGQNWSAVGATAVGETAVRKNLKIRIIINIGSTINL